MLELYVMAESCKATMRLVPKWSALVLCAVTFRIPCQLVQKVWWHSANLAVVQESVRLNLELVRFGLLAKNRRTRLNNGVCNNREKFQHLLELEFCQIHLHKPSKP